jgi:hypothetical protein
VVEANAGAEPRPPSGEAAPDDRRWVVLGVLCLALLVVGIDGTIVNVALPTLVRELGATSSQLQWIVDAYTIVFAAFLLIAGNTGDRLGRKRCFVLGLVIFGAGSLACSQVSTPPALIGFRALQGFGAAFIMPATLSILENVDGEISSNAVVRFDTPNIPGEPPPGTFDERMAGMASTAGVQDVQRTTIDGRRAARFERISTPGDGEPGGERYVEWHIDLGTDELMVSAFAGGASYDEAVAAADAMVHSLHFTN